MAIFNFFREKDLTASMASNPQSANGGGGDAAGHAIADLVVNQLHHSESKSQSIYVFTTISLANHYHNISGKGFIETDY